MSKFIQLHGPTRTRVRLAQACALVTLAVATIAAPSVAAEITLTDIQIAARALSFMEEPLSGSVRVGLVYEHESPASARQAEQLRSQLAGGLKVGGMELTPVMVSIDDVAVAPVDLFLLTEHVSRGVAQVAEASKARRIPCFTTDLSQVESAGCMMAVRSRPKVAVIVNRAAAKDGGITFAVAFRVMITEI